MDPAAFHQMSQTTLSLPGIATGHRDRTSEDVMGGLMRLVRGLSAARETVTRSMGKQVDPEAIFSAVTSVNPLLISFHANDLLDVNRRLSRSFEPILAKGQKTLGPEAAADVIVWLRVCDQTLIAARLMFQMSSLYGLAPNGKPLP